MKTAVSIPDSVFNDAERLVRSTGKSRSQVYSEALKEYVARHSPEAITEALNRVCAEISGPTDGFVFEASRRILKRSEW